MYTEQELSVPISIAFIRSRGYCAKGTKNYWEALNLDFKGLTRGKVTVADIVKYKSDPFVSRLITEVLKEYHGR